MEVVVAALILIIALNIILFKSRSKSIKRMTKIAQAIAQGDFSKKASLAKKGEVEDLARAIDAISSQMNHRMKEAKSGAGRLEAVFLSMAEGVMIVNRDGEILLINETLKKIFHVDNDSTGRKPLEVIRNLEVQEIVDSVLVLRKSVEGHEMSFYLPQERILRVNAAPVLRDGKIDGAVLMFHDITDLRHLETVRKDFVANVSHELRTPVASIKGYSETLLDGAIEDKVHAREFLKIIYSESDRLAKLIDDLLNLARTETGKTALNLKPCQVSQILDSALSGLGSQIKDHGLNLKLNIPANLALVRADESAAKQIFTNLIENAVKYSNSGGEITISTIEKGAWIEITVADNGIGIPQEDLPRIFERFYRVDKSHSRDIPGTGLGLSIVKHIVQAHGGEIKAQSILGQGTTFLFTLPKF